MALRNDSRYPGRFNPSSAAYPQGSFKNRTSPTAKDGSYLEQDWANDQLGFFSALLVNAGVTPNGNVDTGLVSQYFDALKSIIESMNPIKPGFIQLSASQTVPAGGWLPANGAAVSRTTYSALFAAIGTSYGAGNGTTTFNLPDTRGEFFRGFDAGRGIDTGRVFGSSQLDALQNITGSFETRKLTTGDSIFGTNGGQGAFSFSASGTGASQRINASPGGGVLSDDQITFNASNVVRTATETRARNVTFAGFIKF